jgi:hypothetical protein
MMKNTINGLQDNEEITAIIRIRKNPDTQHVLTVLTGSTCNKNNNDAGSRGKITSSS